MNFTIASVDNEHFYLSNLDTPDKSKNKFAGKLKHEFGSVVLDKFIGQISKLYVFNSWMSKEKGFKKKNTGNRDDYYNALIVGAEIVVNEHRKQRVKDRIVTTAQE